MSEENKINTEELKEETKETFNKVKSQIKDTDFKEETKKATSFVKEMFMNPIEAVKEVASGTNLKLGIVIMIMIAIIACGLAYEIVTLIKYGSLYSLGDNIWSLVTTITRPLILAIVPAVVIFIMNKTAKKPLLVVLSTMVVAMVPTIFARVLNLVALIISQLSIITSPLSGAFSVAQTILTYFGVKAIFEEDDETAIKKFIIIEVIASFIILVLGKLNLC